MANEMLYCGINIVLILVSVTCVESQALDSQQKNGLLEQRSVETLHAFANGYSDLHNTTTAVTGQNASVFTLAKAYRNHKIGIGIHAIWLPIIIVVGFVGNTLSLLVVRQAHNRRMPFCVFMGALAVSDNCMLIIATVYWMITVAFPKAVNANSPTAGCQVGTWLFQLFSTYGIFIILCMTVDRFIAIRFPLKKTTLCTPKRAKITALCLFIGTVAYTFPYFLYANYINDYSLCVAFAEMDSFALVYSWLSFVLNAVVPFSSIVVMNVMIIRAIRNRGKRFNRHKPKDIKQSEQATTALRSSVVPVTETAKTKSVDRTREYQMVIMLLLVTLALLLLTVPQFVRQAVFFVIDYKSTPAYYATYILMYNLTNKLYITNNAVNFFLYCMGGSKFRKDIRRALCSCRPKEGMSSLTDSTTSGGQRQAQ